MTRTITQTALVRGATPHDLYETILDARRHSALVGGQPVRVSRRAGGAFAVGKDLEGRTLAFTKDRRIVQSWRANNWPKGVYSKATFAFAKAPGGARITFTQTGVPSEFVGEIAAGWRSYYWTPLRRQFASRRSGGAA
jgi:activator of HSP90 ATPase